MIGAGLVGCMAGPLEDVRIETDDPALEAVLWREVDRFLEAVHPLPVRVDRIGIVDLETAGYWDGRSIWLQPNDDPRRIALVLRHELCHALDATGSRNWRGREDQYAWFAERPIFSAWHSCSDDDRACQLRESFADACEVGPWAAQMLATPCPNDPSHVQAVMQHLLDDVYVNAGPLSERSIGGPGGHVALDEPVHKPWGSTTTDPDTLVLGWDTLRGVERTVLVDLHTGAVTPDPDYSTPRLLPWAGFGSMPALGRPLRQQSTPDGDSLVHTNIETDMFGLFHRVAWVSGDEWGRVGDGCRVPGRSWFRIGDDIGTALPTHDGRGIAWHPVQ